MLGTEIELLISDFDGTLVDTFSANYMAYQKAFAEQGLCLSESQYRACFGFRFDEFMKEVGVVDVNISSRIRELKSVYYPFFFDYLNVNKPLLHFIEMFHVAGGKTAIASTARKKNLINALAHMVYWILSIMYLPVRMLTKENPLQRYIRISWDILNVIRPRLSFLKILK